MERFSDVQILVLERMIPERFLESKFFFAPRSKDRIGVSRCIVIGVMMKHKINADILKVVGSSGLGLGHIDTK
jgi:hypothetical protein